VYLFARAGVGPPWGRGVEVFLVACPHAKQIRGTIAYCALLNRKVSTLRYPCKGNYRRCPVYIRHAARARPAETPKPAPQAPPEQQAPPREEPKPAPPAAEAQARPAAGEGPGRLEPSEALCDSLVLAGLIAVSRRLGSYRGPLRGLLAEASKYLTGKGFLFIVASFPEKGNLQLRLLYAGDKATYAFERDYAGVCGEEASRLFDELAGERVDAIIYLVNWEEIPLHRDRVARELGIA